jgi:hypothetical protein
MLPKTSPPWRLVLLPGIAATKRDTSAAESVLATVPLGVEAIKFEEGVEIPTIATA